MHSHKAKDIHTISVTHLHGNAFETESVAVIYGDFSVYSLRKLGKGVENYVYFLIEKFPE